MNLHLKAIVLRLEIDKTKNSNPFLHQYFLEAAICPNTVLMPPNTFLTPDEIDHVRTGSMSKHKFHWCHEFHPPHQMIVQIYRYQLFLFEF
jgi:hypothetical protein